MSRDRKSLADSVKPEQTVDLETAITKTGYGLFNWMLIILIFPVASAGICANTTMSYVISAAQELKLSSENKALLLSAPFAGMVISGYLWGFLSDIMGRKKLLATGFLLDFILNIGCGTIMSIPVMSLFKFLCGLILCGPYSIFLVYLSEIFSRNHRDMVAQLVGVFTSLGSMAQAGLALWLIPQEMPDWVPFKSWQLFIIMCGLPSLTIGVACLFFYESPKFLVEKGRFEEALKVCRKIYTINTGQSSSSYPVKRLIENTNSPCKKQTVCSHILQAGDLFRTPFILKSMTVFLYFIILFSSQNMLRMWTPEILTLLQNSNMTWDMSLCELLTKIQEEQLIPSPSVYSKMMIVHATCTCFHLLYLFIVHRFGKKKILILEAVVGGLCIASVPHIAAGYMFAVAAIYISLCEVACYAFLGTVVQLFPTNLRAKSIALTMVIGRLGVVIGNFILSKLIYTQCECMFYSLGAGGICLVILLTLLRFTPYDNSVP